MEGKRDEEKREQCSAEGEMKEARFSLLVFG